MQLNFLLLFINMLYLIARYFSLIMEPWQRRRTAVRIGDQSRSKRPLFPPDFLSSRTSLMVMALSTALHIS